MNLQAAIAEFQHHVGAPQPANPDFETVSDAEMFSIAATLRQQSNFFKDKFAETGNNIYLRAELILEEVSEIFAAMCARDEVKLLDGIVDAVYVIIGMAVSFNLPFNEAFYAVHMSNMTKSSAAAKHSGDKGKGPGFVPADIAKVIERFRK